MGTDRSMNVEEVDYLFKQLRDEDLVSLTNYLISHEMKSLPKAENCKYCKEKATKRVIWADGRAYIPVCDGHEGKAREVIKGQNDEVTSVRKISEMKALDTDADPSPNRGARKLRNYWVHGEGAAKIKWGSDGDFNRCVTHLGKYVTDPKGLCNVYHRAALGAPPGKGH